jgi:lysophospholipase L1-like esterase
MKNIVPFAILLISLVMGNGITACHKQKITTASTIPARMDAPAPPAPASGYTYLALGDSYTIGQSVGAAERFPYLTVVNLRSLGLAIQDPKYIAVTGWTTTNLQAAIAAQEPLGTYDMVTLLIGVNDQYQHQDTAGYRIRFTQLLQRSVSLAGGRKTHVFVLSIPDYSATPFVSSGYKMEVSKEIDAFNAINKKITAAAGIQYINITLLTREAANDPSLLASDGLHYSAKEHQQWADLLTPLVKAAL